MRPANVTATVIGHLLGVLDLPAHWPEPTHPRGVLIVAFPDRTHNVSAVLPSGRCELYGKNGRNKAWLNSMTMLAEAILATALLREQMSPPLPIALATTPSVGAFLASRAEVRWLWDLYVHFDVAAARRRLERLRRLSPESVRIRPDSYSSLWKLAALMLAPFERTLFIDADIMVLSRTLPADLLQNSLRLYDVAMPVDVNRQGNLDTRWLTARNNARVYSKVTAYQKASDGTWKAPPKCARGARCPVASSSAAPHTGATTTASPTEGDEHDTSEEEEAAQQVLAPPVFSRGYPPMCSCIVAYTRAPKVRRLFLHGAARLFGMMNPTDPTNATLGVRQSDQEMLWFELHTGEPSRQPSVLLLPEEYYCPAAVGSRQAFDFATWLNDRRKPWWGYARAMPRDSKGRTMASYGYIQRTQDRYVAGSVKDCHAVHTHLTSTMLHHWNVGSVVPRLDLWWIIQKMPLEMFCFQRHFFNITPGCSVPHNASLDRPWIVANVPENATRPRKRLDFTKRWPVCITSAKLKSNKTKTKGKGAISKISLHSLRHRLAYLNDSQLASLKVALLTVLAQVRNGYSVQ